jgi:hypothetical protein
VTSRVARSMWTTRCADCPGGVRVALDRGLAAAPYIDVIDGWCRDPEFRSWFSSVLAGASFQAFRWETPAVDVTTATRPFEFVLLDSPQLARRPDPGAFQDQFERTPNADVLEFPNLGGDAIMVVPRPIGPRATYGHLAAFVRDAPEAQRGALWRVVGEAMRRRLSRTPVWLSTAGAGVSWLHVRLDDRPKYYGFAPFRHAAPTGANED